MSDTEFDDLLDISTSVPSTSTPPTTGKRKLAVVVEPIGFTLQEIDDIVAGKQLDYQLELTEGDAKSAVGANDFFYIDMRNISTEKLYRTKFVQCKRCSNRYTSKQGHEARHAKRCSAPSSSSNQVKPVGSMKDIITEAHICLGTSFNIVENPAFVKLLVDVVRWSRREDRELKESDIPSRKTIKEHMIVTTDARLRDVFETKVKKLLKGGLAHLMIDYGLKYHSYLSVKVTILEEISDEFGDVVWKLCAIPVGFIPCDTHQKTAEETFAIICEDFESFGIEEEHVRNMYLSADGDSAMKKLGESVMSGYSRCTAHLLHLIAKAIEKPYEETLENLDDVDLATVEAIGTVISCARKICHTIRDKRSSFPVDAVLPTLPVKTRWLSELRCLRDVVKNSATLNTSQTQKQYAELFKRSLLTEALIEIYDIMKKLLDKYEKSSTLICEVIPDFLALQDTFERMIDNQSHDIRSIGRLGYQAMAFHKKKMSPLLFAACRLTPQLRSLRGLKNDFPQIERKADDVIQDAWNVLKPHFDETELEKNKRRKKVKNTSSAFGRFRDAKVGSSPQDEITVEMRQYLAFTDDEDHPVEWFWPKYKSLFPRLYLVARRVFTLSTNEASCERSFSLLNQAVTPCRCNMRPETVKYELLGKELEMLNINS